MRRVLIILIILCALAAASFFYWRSNIQTISAEEEEFADSVQLPVVHFTCWPDDTPAGALAQQPGPMTCGDGKFPGGPDTSTLGVNSWLDDFDHGLSFKGFGGTNYRIFERLGAYRTIHWRHADHWMLDMTPHPEVDDYGWDKGSAMMRPNRSFTFEDGKLIIETDVAAGMMAYGVEAWPEIVVSAAPQPAGRLSGGGYAYDMFPNHWTLGCRLNASRRPVCALKGTDGNQHQTSTKVWEMSHFQKVGTNVYGGTEIGDHGPFWRVCQVSDPDGRCRDRFRLELTRTSLTLYVNGIKYFQQTGIPPLPNALVYGDVYVYLASTHVLHPADTIRYHWDHFTVNTEQPPSAAASFVPPSS